MLALLVVLTNAEPPTLTVNVLPRVLPSWFAAVLRTNELNSITTYSASLSLSLFVTVPRLKVGLTPSPYGLPAPPVILAAGRTKVGVTLLELPEITGLEPIATVDDEAHVAPLLQTKATFVVLSFIKAIFATMLSTNCRLVVVPSGRSIMRR